MDSPGNTDVHTGTAVADDLGDMDIRIEQTPVMMQLTSGRLRQLSYAPYFILFSNSPINARSHAAARHFSVTRAENCARLVIRRS